jgi:hypothetical protein
MDSKPRKSQHASYRRHRGQVAWQIILPIVLAGLILVGATYLIVVSTFRGNGDVGRWAAISTIWLTIPVLIGGLVELALFIALAWAVGKAVGFIPPYTYKAQVFVSEVEARVKQGVVYAYRPMHLVSQVGRFIRNGIRKVIHR